MDCEIIHETVVRDIVDVINGIKDSDELKGLRNKTKSFSSIAKAASKLTVVFPVLCDSSLSIETDSMGAKAIERQATSMLQILFSAISVTDADNAIDYIKNFHTNLNIDNDITVDSFIDFMDNVVSKNESSIYVNNQELYDMAKKDLKNLNFTLPENISESSLSRFSIMNSYGREIVTEARYNDNKNIPKSKIKLNIDNLTLKANTLDNRNGRKGDGDISNILKNRAELMKNQILPSDVKKANELMPTMMIVNFVSKDADTSTNIPMQAIIGVKAKIYTIDSTDIINRIIIKNQDHQGFLKLVKATTREISFFRDFLFAIDRAKLDALSQSKKASSSKVWKILERRALKGKIRRYLGMTNDATAISTLMISQEVAEYLAKNENIDVTNSKVARQIMESYNLMGFSIMDESSEIAKFLFDTGDDMFESVPFRHLEKESNGDYKKIVNLMTKIS